MSVMMLIEMNVLVYMCDFLRVVYQYINREFKEMNECEERG